MAMNTIEKAKPISLNDLEKLKSEIEQSIKALVSNIPKGAIMWFNLTSAPTGWVVCDGNNGTPDLRGRYPLGAVSGIGTTVSAGLPNITGTIGPILEEAAFDKLQLVMTEAGELDVKAPYDKIVNNKYAESVKK